MPPTQGTPGAHTERWLRGRGAFVGREPEVQQLRSAFESATNGHGALIVLVGEPGIGKTSLCESLAAFVVASGGQALVGHCYDEGSFRLPYMPFVEAFEAYAQEDDADTFRADLGSGAADIARIVPTVRERLSLSPPLPASQEEDRERLLRAASDLLRTAAKRRPLLLVLEDLHDADRGTLDLLSYVARRVEGSRLLVVGTYRDVDVDRAHPLSAALTELRRAHTFARIQLRGLSPDEVHQLLAETSQQTVPRQFAELLHRQADGNPLFVHEMLRFLIDEGLVQRRDGALRRVGGESLASRIPEGLRDVVAKRLSRLGSSTNELLAVASVIGREFQLEILRRVSGQSHEELESALDEASAATIIEERSVVGTTITYRFTHAFFRETLYDEIVAPRRIRLHQQVARELESVHSRHLDQHAAELAEHYAYSSEGADLAKAVRFGELAARRAADVFAFGESVRHLERAVVVLELADPDDIAKRCDLLLALSEALFSAGETERVIRLTAPEALQLAERLGDPRRAFRACRLGLDSLYARGGATSVGQPEYVQWAERLQRYAEPDSIERVHADLAVALTMGADRWREARSLQTEALALARQHGHLETMFVAAFYLIFAGPPEKWNERLQLAEEATTWPRDDVNGRAVGMVLWVAGRLQLAHGNRARAEELWKQIDELAARTNVATAAVSSTQRDAILAIIDGHLEEALALSERFVAHSDELGAPLRGRLFNVQLMLPLMLYLGRASEWLRLYDEYAALAGARGSFPEATVTQGVGLAHLGRLDEAEALVDQWLNPGSGDSVVEDSIHLQVLLLQAATLLGKQQAAATLTQRLSCVAHLTGSDFFYTCLGRHLGDAAVLCGDRNAACTYYSLALESAGKIRFRPELALTRLRLAELLVEDAKEGMISEAMEHLAIAIPELRAMNMRPALELALSLSNRVAPPPAVESLTRGEANRLTAREREVARLLTDSLSNREIAEKLVLSEGTVEVHVKRILSKLGFRSRSQVAVWASQQFTVQPERGPKSPP
jgi:DNA-binding CsgD family transcriptional regulator